MGEQLDAISEAGAPVLAPRLWYGMPVYAKLACFFRRGAKFKEKYMTLLQLSMRRFL